MLLTILLAALQAAQASAAAVEDRDARLFVQTLPGDEKCPRATLRHTGDKARLGPRRLIELPPGRLELAVMREVGGCPIPAVVREGIGAQSPPRTVGRGR